MQLRDRSLTPDGAAGGGPRLRDGGARGPGCLFVVNDDPVLARDAGADGVHLGQGDGSIAAAREIMGGGIVGRTTRGGDALAAAVAEGADYASVSPVWETATHPTRTGGRARSGRRRAGRRELPWFALGGIDERRAFRVAALERAGSPWCAPSPRRTTRPRSWPLCGRRSTRARAC